MSYNQGGQRRTAILTCGYTAKGSVREANGKVRLHMKVCEICKMSNGSKIYNSSFNKDQGENNGWGGVKGSKKVESVLGTATIYEKDGTFEDQFILDKAVSEKWKEERIKIFKKDEK